MGFADERTVGLVGPCGRLRSAMSFPRQSYGGRGGPLWRRWRAAAMGVLCQETVGTGGCGGGGEWSWLDIIYVKIAGVEPDSSVTTWLKMTSQGSVLGAPSGLTIRHYGLLDKTRALTTLTNLPV